MGVNEMLTESITNGIAFVLPYLGKILSCWPVLLLVSVLIITRRKH